MAQLFSPLKPEWTDEICSPWKNADEPLESMTANCRQPIVSLPSTRAVTVSSADFPSDRKSKPFGPSVGSVRCCVSTAPTPARAYGQREPTPMLDVVTAAPNIPVRAHFPTSENVIFWYLQTSAKKGYLAKNHGNTNLCREPSPEKDRF